MREVYAYIQLNCYWYPPRKTGALWRSRLLLLAPDFSKRLRRADSNEGWLAAGLSTENCFFFQHQDSLALASFCSSPDLTQIDCNEGDQASHAPQNVTHLLLQRHQKCGQSCGVQFHQQLMRQQFRHSNNATVNLSPPSVVIQFFLGTTSNLQLRGQPLHQLLPKGQT